MARRFYRIVIHVLLVVSLLPAMAAGQTLDQTDRLAGLCKVWGFLKYYQDSVATGKVDWDTVLIEGIPKVKAASEKSAFNHEILMIIRASGFMDSVKEEEDTPDSICMADFGWMDDQILFYPFITDILKAIKVHHRSNQNRFYSTYFARGNCNFEMDSKFSQLTNAGEEYRLLALFRFWNIIQYFYPYKNVMGEDWQMILKEFIPRFLQLVNDGTAYHLLMREFTARLHDSHANFSSIPYYAWRGSYMPAFFVSWIEEQVVVTSLFPELLGGVDIQNGDIIMRIDGKPIGDLIREKRKYVAASNEVVLMRDMLPLLFYTNASTLTLTVQRDEVERTLIVPCRGIADVQNAKKNAEPTEASAILPGNIGYVHMGRLLSADVDRVMLELLDTRAIIFDIRNYPQFVLYQISQYLNPQKRDFSLFHYPDTSNPGYFYKNLILYAGPDVFNPNYYKGKVILLVNEQTQSRAEFTAMCLQTAPDVTTIGSKTTGADGNTSSVFLTGKITVYFTGLGVFYPDGSPTQRVGIKVDVVAQPTIDGIKTGRDEVLERALTFIEKGN